MESAIKALKTDDPDVMILNMGPQHPSTHGVARLVLRLRGEKVEKVEPVIGYLHRGIEKLAENRNYSQFIPLTDRCDYLAPMSYNMVYAMALEELMDIQVPERADYIRVILLELQRISSHLVFWGSFGMDLGAWTVLIYAMKEREKIIDLFDMATGGRLLYTYIYPGGLRDDLPEGFVEKCREVMGILPGFIENFEDYCYKNDIFLSRCKGVGVMNAKDLINMGVTGPILRASGVDYDVRKDDPYSIYDRFKFNVATDENGDVLARMKVRLDEMKESIKIINQALDGLPEGDYRAKVPKIIKPPAGEVYSRVDSPRGELGMHVISDGAGQNPYRVKIRSPAFCNLSAFPAMSEGDGIPDVVANFASIDIVLGCVDR